MERGGIAAALHSCAAAAAAGIGTAGKRAVSYTHLDVYKRQVLNRRLAVRRTILTPSLECGDTSLLIRMLEIDRGVSFLPWYAVENSVKEGRLIRLSVEDCYISLYRQIFSHKEKWRTREMDEFVRVAKLADEEE